MGNFTMSNVDADVSMLMGSLSSNERSIPSLTKLLKNSFTIPFTALILSVLSDVNGYIWLFKENISAKGYYAYFLSDGWAVIIPTAVVGLLFSFMTYNNLMVYMAVPDSVRRKSIILSHLKKVAKRTVTFFLMLMVLSALLSGVYSWMALAIPALLVILLFAVNLVVGAEINRLGAGLALQKISALINKI